MDLARVYRALRELQEEFLAEPGLFFNESDLACRCHCLMQEALDYEMVELLDGVWTCLLHHEYPTPFLCDLSGTEFVVKRNGEKTPQGGEYQRAYYDLVVFNPTFLNRCSYELAKGQDYALLREELPRVLERVKEPAFLLGVKFILNRKPLAVQQEAEDWCAKVERDYRKLRASLMWEGQPFMENTMMLAFDAAGGEYRRMIEEKLNRCEGLVFCGV